MWGVDWIRLAQDKDQWWAVVSAVMNLLVLAPLSLLVLETKYYTNIFLSNTLNIKLFHWGETKFI
jgi:hypothetical protein